mmetsp:Transcript_10500/g.34504  ORF Transcript_10500/g.34504 Transcript_10500/m.34504 type:complete len:90 (+) Transcript_10500:758-1027(+)
MRRRELAGFAGMWMLGLAAAAAAAAAPVEGVDPGTVAEAAAVAAVCGGMVEEQYMAYWEHWLFSMGWTGQGGPQGMLAFYTQLQMRGSF